MLLDLSLDRCGCTGVVPRPRLIARLQRGDQAPLVGMIAPAGFGKTCLMLDWQRRDERATAWLAIDARDNDPCRLRDRVASALGPDPTLLMLDDLGALVEPAAFSVLMDLASRLHAGSQIAFATRSEPALPLGSLRAHRALIELRANELAFDRHETTVLLRALGVRLGRAEVDALRASTEGWPAGLYLAALSIRGNRDLAAAARRFSGADRLVCDYVQDELLASMPERSRELLLASSVLEQPSGPACDSLVRQDGSAAILATLAREGLLVPASAPELRGQSDAAPEDAGMGKAAPGERYRCRVLLRQALLARLREERPGLEIELHRRASDWYASVADCDAVVAHALAAGDPGRAAAPLWADALAQPSRFGGDELDRRLSRFTDSQLASSPELATLVAHNRLAGGDLGAAERWALVAEDALAPRAALNGKRSIATAVEVVRAIAAGRHDLLEMAELAAAACRLDADGRWRALCRLIEGVGRHLTGDRSGATAALERGLSAGAHAPAEVRARTLAQLALVALEAGERERGEALAERASAEAAACLPLEAPALAIVPALMAWTRISSGGAAEAKHDLHTASMLLDVASDSLPCLDAQARLVLARAALPLGELGTARELLSHASRSARQTPQARVLLDWLQQGWSEADTASALALPGAAQLTLAELRVMRMLPTHLSFEEIAARLHVSRNTVKTQAASVYRKLDVSSRSQAVARASEIGLVQ